MIDDGARDSSTYIPVVRLQGHDECALLMSQGFVFFCAILSVLSVRIR